MYTCTIPTHQAPCHSSEAIHPTHLPHSIPQHARTSKDDGSATSACYLAWTWVCAPRKSPATSVISAVLTVLCVRFESAVRDSRSMDEDAGNVLSSMQNSMWGGEYSVSSKCTQLKLTHACRDAARSSGRGILGLDCAMDLHSFIISAYPGTFVGLMICHTHCKEHRCTSTVEYPCSQYNLMPAVETGTETLHAYGYRAWRIHTYTEDLHDSVGV